MVPLRDAIVTLNSLLPPRTVSEGVPGNRPDLTPAQELKVQRYYQIMDRLEQETEATGDGVMVTVQDREVSLAQSKLAEDFAAGAAGQPLGSGGQEVKFGTGFSGMDWFRWIWSLTDHVDQQDFHPMLRATSALAEPLPDRAIVGLAADWGTGLYGAPKIADQFRAMSGQRKFDLLMHLGDVYYSGTPKEVKERFTDIWPTAAGAINRAINGNHEMYSGGFGYFQQILPAFNQPASYFAFQNTRWLLVGLDTAYVDHDIDNEQVAWLTLLVRQARAKGQKVVLFSHQQPFSRLDHQGPKLQKALNHLLRDQAITAWYWGHEHDCVVYDVHPEWQLFGRCLGNGGIPQARNSAVRQAPADTTYPGPGGCTWRRFAQTPDSPGCVVLDGPNMDMKKGSDQQKFVPHGFVTLEFEDDTLVEHVYLSNGTELYRNVIR